MEPIIPANEKGKAVDLSESVDMNEMSGADKLYTLACSRLLRPWQWHELSGKAAARFTVMGHEAVHDSDEISVGDFIQIDIHAPGKDWVRVKNIEKDFIADADKSFAVKLMVSANPLENADGVDHFFGDGASSTFVIIQKGTVVTAAYHGRNGTPNTDASGAGEMVRNVVVAFGAIIGLSELQWKALLKGLLEYQSQN